jgi:competence protein ComEC
VSPHDARLAPAAAAAWLAAACQWLGWGWLPLVGLGVALGVGLLRRAARPATVVAIAAALAGTLAGWGAAVAAAPVRQAVGDHATLAATVETDAAPGGAGPTKGLWRVELAVTVTDGTATRARVVVWGGDSWRQMVRGQHVIIEGKLAPATGGAAALMWRPTVETVSPPRGLAAAVAALRGGLREATDGLPERLRPLTRGMVIGDDSGMSADQRAQMSLAGLTHLTAVSGSHFAIVLVAMSALLRLVVQGLFAWGLLDQRLRKHSRRVVACVTGASMGLLVCVVFPEPSVMRAATMAAVICVALWWGRPAQALPALSAGVVAVAVLDPRLACEPGFVMSAAAVAAIALWAPALAARLERVVPAIVAHPLAVCVTAQAAVLPLLALIDGGVGPWSIAANLAVGWCAAPVTLIGLCALLVAPLSPPLAHVFATIAGWSAWPVDAVARTVTELPGAQLVVPPGAWGAAASGIVVALVVTLTFATRLRLGLPVLASLLVIGGIAVPLAPRWFANVGPGNWLVVACDVGQGDGMLLRSGPRSAVVIDVGAEGGPGSACLARYGVTRIDLLIITHPHADHEGAVPQVLARVPVKQAWISPAEGEQPTAATRALRVDGVPVTVVHTGQTAVIGDVRVAVLAPDRDGVGEGSTGLNDASVVTVSTVGGVTVLGLGDLEHEGQRALAARLSPLVVDVVKVPHHGSDRQEAALAQLVTARVAVVSVGAGNTYGHPAPDALALWGGRASLVLRTDHCGDIVVVEGPALATACPTDVAG